MLRASVKSKSKTSVNILYIYNILEIVFPKFLEIFIMTHLVGIDKGPVMEWTNDLELGEKYRKWKKCVENTIQGATQ